MIISEINQTTATLNDQSRAISELVVAQNKLYVESQEIYQEILNLGKKYQEDLKKLTDKQSIIAEKSAAIDEMLLKLVKVK
jgi:hypothetical protein